MWKARWVALSEPRTFSFKQFKEAAAESEKGIYTLREGKKVKIVLIPEKKSISIPSELIWLFPTHRSPNFENILFSSFLKPVKLVAIFDIISIIPYSPCQNT